MLLVLAFLVTTACGLGLENVRRKSQQAEAIDGERDAVSATKPDEAKDNKSGLNQANAESLSKTEQNIMSKLGRIMILCEEKTSRDHHFSK